jgi:hypothetical protein
MIYFLLIAILLVGIINAVMLVLILSVLDKQINGNSKKKTPPPAVGLVDLPTVRSYSETVGNEPFSTGMRLIRDE